LTGKRRLLKSLSLKLTPTKEEKSRMTDIPLAALTETGIGQERDLSPFQETGTLLRTGALAVTGQETDPEEERTTPLALEAERVTGVKPLNTDLTGSDPETGQTGPSLEKGKAELTCNPGDRRVSLPGERTLPTFLEEGDKGLPQETGFVTGTTPFQ
jgi:hypothetical protein